MSDPGTTAQKSQRLSTRRGGSQQRKSVGETCLSNGKWTGRVVGDKASGQTESELLKELFKTLGDSRGLAHPSH